MATTAKKTRVDPRLTSATVKESSVSKADGKHKKTGDEVWEELLATPESEAFLTLMVAEVRREEAEGKLIDGGWDAL